MADKWQIEALAEAFEGSPLEGSKRLWQGRRARGKNRALGRESGAEDPRFGKATFPLAPPLPPGYAKGGGGVAGVPDWEPGQEANTSWEPSLTNAERAWLSDHDMPFPTTNRTVVLRRVQEWDAQIATIVSRLLKGRPGIGPAELSKQTSLFETSKAYLERLHATKIRSRTRKKK